jgi:chitinase domain-containing protein 1
MTEMVVFVAHLLILLPFVSCTVDVSVSESGEVSLDEKPCSERVSARGVSARDLVECSSTIENPAVKSSVGTTLAYVTPWNSQGYDVAKHHTAKFDLIAPVWLQLRSSQRAAAEITGVHDIDAGWISELRKGCSRKDSTNTVKTGTGCPRIVPRLIWEIQRLDPTVLDAALDAISGIVARHAFDGIVLEGPVHSAVFRGFIARLSSALHAAGAILVLVLPPPVYLDHEGMILASAADAPRGSQPARGVGPAVVLELAVSAAVDWFSVMTYDYSSSRGGAPGPNTPIQWSVDTLLGLAASAQTPDERSLLLRKLLLGVPFYG